MLTVAAAYGAYIVADELAAASGVLAVVTLGKLSLFTSSNYVEDPEVY